MNFTTNSGIIITILSIVNLTLLVCGTFFFNQVEKFYIMVLKTLSMTVGGFGWFVCAVISDIIFTQINMPVCKTIFYILLIITAAFGIFSFIYFLKNTQVLLGIKLMSNETE